MPIHTDHSDPLGLLTDESYSRSPAEAGWEKLDRILHHQLKLVANADAG